MFLSGNYRLITVPLKFYGLNTNVFARNEASRANLLVLRTPNSIQAATINREFQDINTLLSLLFITKFSSAGQFNSQLIYFKSFEIKAKRKIRKIKHTKTHLIQFQLFIFYKPTCTEQFSPSTVITLVIVPILSKICCCCYCHRYIHVLFWKAKYGVMNFIISVSW